MSSYFVLLKKKIKMSHLEQMHLCTICPFPTTLQDTDLKEVQEANLSISFRTQELRIAKGNTTVSMPIHILKTKEWLTLIGTPYCKCVLLVIQNNSTIVPVGLRIYLQKETLSQCLHQNQLCDTNFLSFESTLARTLQETKYFIEQDTKRRKTIWDLSPKQIDVHTNEMVIEGLYWSFFEGCFTKEPGAINTYEILPTLIVASAFDQWQEIVLSQVSEFLTGFGSSTRRRNTNVPVSAVDNFIVLPNVMFVLTHNKNSWKKAAEAFNMDYLELESRGLPIQKLQNNGPLIITGTVNDIMANMSNLSNLWDTVEQSLQIIQHHPVSKRQNRQIRRIILDLLVRKFPSFYVPFELIQWGLLVLDDIETLFMDNNTLAVIHDKMCLRTLQICYDNQNTKPKGLTNEQVSLCVGPFKSQRVPSWANPHILSFMEPLVQVIPVPKGILKKFKVFGHLVRNGPTEDRIQKVFSSKYCPVPNEDAVVRFAGKALPQKLVEGLVEKHFSRLQISFGSFLESSTTSTDSSPSSIQKQYVLDSLSNKIKTCCICFESCEPTGYGISICGHIYCSDCSRQQFNADWTLYKTKDCASCRTPLTSGDFFQVMPPNTVDSFTTILPIKDQSVVTFLNGLRSLHNVEIWNPNKGPFEAMPKHVIVSSIQDISPRQFLNKFTSSIMSSTNCSIHIFYTPNESILFEKFQNAF